MILVCVIMISIVSRRLKFSVFKIRIWPLSYEISTSGGLLSESTLIFTSILLLDARHLGSLSMLQSCLIDSVFCINGLKLNDILITGLKFNCLRMALETLLSSTANGERKYLIERGNRQDFWKDILYRPSLTKLDVGGPGKAAWTKKDLSMETVDSS